MSDLIGRQAALNQITAIDTSIIPYVRARDYVDEFKNYVIKIIETLPSAEPEQIWIPVTERLPEDDTDVLVQFSNNMTVGFYKYSRWRIATGADLYCSIEDYEEKPIAWMPLPEPYRGE